LGYNESREKTVNILFVDTFDDDGRAYGNFRAQGIANNDHWVGCFSDKNIALQLGTKERDKALIDIIIGQKIDLVLFVKCLEACGGASAALMQRAKKLCQVGYIFLEPMCSITDEICNKASIADFVIVEKKNTYEKLKSFNKNTFNFYEGCDHRLERKRDVPIQFDVLFLGELYGTRREILDSIRTCDQVVVIQDAFGTLHSEAVSSSKINLNLCTAAGASNRVWKILWAAGFLLTDDWDGREDYFIDGKHLVIFDGADDLNKKIAYYLENEEERLKIADAGRRRVAELNMNLDNFGKHVVQAATSVKGLDQVKIPSQKFSAPKLKDGTIDCPILVATSNAFLPMLKPFAYLFNEFWSPSQPVIILGYQSPDFDLPANFKFVSMGPQRGIKYWANDLKKYLSSLDFDYFIYSPEDMFLSRPVDFKSLGVLLDLAQELSPGRIALGNAVANEKNQLYISRNDHDIIVQKQRSLYRLSLQWGIWRKDYFMKYLHSNFSQWDFEVQNMEAAANDGTIILGCKDNFPLGYCNAVETGGNVKDFNFQNMKLDFRDVCSHLQPEKRTQVERNYIDRMIEMKHIDRSNILGTE
jgi:hypothetical protein